MYWIHTVTRTGRSCLMWRWRVWSCSSGSSRGLRRSWPTSTVGDRLWTTLVLPGMEPLAHGRVSQGGWRHGRCLVAKCSHHGQGGPSESRVTILKHNYMLHRLWLGGWGRVWVSPTNHMLGSGHRTDHWLTPNNIISQVGAKLYAIIQTDQSLIIR